MTPPRNEQGSPEGIIEVELKFRLEDLQVFREKLADHAARPRATIRQQDAYFAHPLRDFAKTDEALRIRMTDDSGHVTYKGPRFDAETKSRQETEIAFAGGPADAERFALVLEQLGFATVRTVSKQRELWDLASPEGDIEIAIDSVEGLGTFVELERTVPANQFNEAKAAIQSLARDLGLAQPEHRSYLALLLVNEKT